MTKQVNATWLVVGLTVALIASIVTSTLKVGAAERSAIVHELEAEEMARQREVAEDILLSMRVEYTAQAASLAILHDSVAYTMDRARSARLRAATLTDTLRSHLAAVAGDSVRVVVLVDSITVAHRSEVYALETQLSVALTENAALWSALDRSDALLAQQVDVNELLHMEIAALRQTVTAWQAVARPGLLIRVRDNLGIVAGSVTAGALACAAFCR